MSVDLKQFHQVFIEESVEGLDAMEAALMALDITTIDDELINTIFRSAHSIKGGAGTFGFSALASFTHVLETLLDEVRAGERGLTLDHVNLLLTSVDCMREMLEIIQDERNEYTAKATEVQSALEQVLNPQSAHECGVEEFVGANAWVINFKPEPYIIRTGNDPLRLIRELSQLGESIEVECHGEIPKLAALNSEDCCLSWLVTLVGDNINEQTLREVFEWVEDDCELLISPKQAAAERECNRWEVHFAPYPHLFQTGNDPLRIMKELSQVATIDSIAVHTKGLPALKLLDAEKCYIAWVIEVSGPTKKTELEDVFEWVIGEADIHIHPATQSVDQLSVVASEQSRAALEEVAAMVPSDASLTAVQENAAAPVQAITPNTPVPKSSPKKASQSEASSIRVGTDKIDSLINMVGELVITQSMLGQLGSEFTIENLPKLIEGLNQLEQNTRELQESVMRIRMLPISFAFSRFPRMVRDLGQELGKDINLELQGENTELDKTVMEKIGDPLVHLVRNSIDHGIETSDERIAAGKSAAGTVTLNAYHQGGNVVIEIMDDGRGLDRERIIAKGIERELITEADALTASDESVFDLIFQPGFSTAQAVSNLSGRGVGMDVVKKNIQSLNGMVEIQSQKDKGTKIKISLPLTLAILDGQLVRVRNETYIFPLVSIVESMQYNEKFVNHIAGGCNVFKLREEYVPIVDLAEVFGYQKTNRYDNALMVVAECDGFKVAMVVDELMAQQQVVIKSLEQNYQRVEGISGATILGDGTVALIIDVPSVVRLAGADQKVTQQTLRRSA